MNKLFFKISKTTLQWVYYLIFLPFIYLLLYIFLMSESLPCPKCHSENTYSSDGLMVCPECFYEWNPDEVVEAEHDDTLKVIDSNGNELQNGDSVIVIKDLPVKGMPKPVKAGTKVKNIRLTDGDHNIDCKIEGFGAMSLKSEFVRKA